MPRFVLLLHDHPELHYDLMLEAGDVLWTWRLEAPPGDSPRIATRINDHRPFYLTYEGPVSGNRGSVRRWDQGSFTWLKNTDTERSVRLQGERLSGLLHLVRREGEIWQAVYVPGLSS